MRAAARRSLRQAPQQPVSDTGSLKKSEPGERAGLNDWKRGLLQVPRACLAPLQVSDLADRRHGACHNPIKRIKGCRSR